MEEFAKAGLIPPGTHRNRKFQEERISFSKDIPDWKQWVLFDAQTSGGLILSVPAQEVDWLLERLHAEGVKEAAVIGHVVEEPRGEIMVS